MDLVGRFMSHFDNFKRHWYVERHALYIPLNSSVLQVFLCHILRCGFCVLSSKIAGLCIRSTGESFMDTRNQSVNYEKAISIYLNPYPEYVHVDL